MLSLIRFLAFGWIFAFVLAAAWLGVLVPVDPPGPTAPVTAPAPTEPESGMGGTPAGPGPDSVPTLAPRLDGAQPCPRIEPPLVLFGPNATFVGPEAQDEIAAFVLRLRSADCVADTVGTFCSPHDIEVSVAGHTDDSPSARPGGNPRLSFDRALGVALLLDETGLTVRSVEGYGAARPLPTPPAPAGGTATGPDGAQGGPGPVARRAELSLWCPRLLSG